MKYSVLLIALLAVLLCGPVSAQAPPPAPLKITLAGTESMAQVLAMIPAGTSVELHLRSGEKMAGVLVGNRPAGAGVNGSVGPLVRLTKLTGAEYFDGLISVADISAVVLKGLPPAKMP